MKEKWFFIVNPHAGFGSCLKKWEKAETIINKHEIDFDVAYTSAPHQGGELTTKAIKDGFNRIIIVSGDGVLNEAVNGIMTLSETQREQVVLGVLPFGTGNDYNTVLGLPWNPETAVNTLLEKTLISPVSVGKFFVEETGFHRYFINVLDTGISSLVGHAANLGEGSLIKGPRKYTYLALKKLITIKQKKAKITLDENDPIDIKLMLVTIGTGKCNGGGMLCCVDGHPQNDQFNVFITKNVTKLQTLIGIKRIFAGAHKTMKGTIFTFARKVKLEVEKPVPFQFDGEVYVPDSIGETLHAEIIPYAINVLYNPNHPSVYWITADAIKAGKKPKLTEDKGMTHGEARKWQEKN